ncbi:MAG: YvcK family protein [Gammaproteobacteria bacterium]|nr:YvcK family protein [Gammaproteobacteria bacterium]
METPKRAAASIGREVFPHAPAKLVVIGGGSGSFSVLSGLKSNLSVDISAICSMMDSGGHSGLLRDACNVLPPGDVRRCLVALSQQTELLRDLFSYRLDEAPYRGTNIGNLMILALTRLLGSEEQAIEGVSRILNIRGEVIPVTLANTHLNAVLSNGEIIRGEANIDTRSAHLTSATLPSITSVFLDPSVDANEKAVSAILDADFLIVAPGDIYTSIVPNLLVSGIAEAISHSSAPMLYAVNLMTKHGETDSWTATKHVEVISAYAGRVPDGVIAHRGIIPPELASSYRVEHAAQVLVDADRLRDLGVRLVFETDVMSRTSVIRHDPQKTAEAIAYACGELAGQDQQRVAEAG